MVSKWQAKKVNLGGAIIGGAVALAIGVLIGLGWQNVFSNFLPYLGFSKPVSHDWSSLDDIYALLAENYDGDLDQSAMLDGAKSGMVEAVGDTYTSYMDSKSAREFEKSLHGEVGAGIGVEMGMRDGYVRVIRTLPDNPARKAGILAGDIIYKVDGEEVYELSTEEIANKVRGTAGTEVTVTIVRDGEEKSFTMTREEINNVSADITYDDNTAIITVTRFDTDTGKIIQDFAQEFQNRGIEKVILDLRGNGGGYVSAAADLLSLWIDGDKILIQKSKHSSDDTTYANHGKAILANTETIVLVNGSTASASEIVAGALQDYQKATIIGETTYGKGVVQTLLNLSGGALLKVTTAKWYTPLGKTINGTGITPDEEVINTFEDINAGRDPQLDAAKAK